jgi:hypothetical protein
LRLKAAGLSDRQIARSIGSARSTVQACLHRAGEAGLDWREAEALDEEALQARLYRCSVPLSARPQPDFSAIHAELNRPGVTRLLLWQEYKAAHPDGWQYSVFCDRYRRWLLMQDPVLRRNHAPGEKLFVDYAGQTVPVTDRYTGESREAVNDHPNGATDVRPKGATTEGDFSASDGVIISCFLMLLQAWIFRAQHRRVEFDNCCRQAPGGRRRDAVDQALRRRAICWGKPGPIR